MPVLSPVSVVVAVVVVHVCTILVCKMCILLVLFKEGGKGISEKSALCTLVKMEIIRDDPLTVSQTFTVDLALE